MSWADLPHSYQDLFQLIGIVAGVGVVGVVAWVLLP